MSGNISNPMTTAGIQMVVRATKFRCTPDCTVRTAKSWWRA
jgi:hypothetical protein